MKKAREVKGDVEITEVSWRDQERQLAREESVRQQKLSKMEGVSCAMAILPIVVGGIVFISIFVKLPFEEYILPIVGFAGIFSIPCWLGYCIYMAIKHR